MKYCLVSFISIAISLSANAQGLNIKGKNSTAIIADEAGKSWYDSKYHFAPAHRAGDYVYFSGVVAGAYESDEPIGKEAFKVDLRKRFQSLERTLKAAGSSFDDVIKINTYHVFDSPHISIDKVTQIDAVAEVKDEFINEPYPAWTAVGTTALFPDKGLVEIEIVAYSPITKPAAN